MRKVLLSLAAIAAIAGVISAKTSKTTKTPSEPVLMTIDGRPVYKSEFEYLYNKNASQQVEQQSLADYVEMFVNYKLKVADALANKYDTTSTYKTELAQYRAELAAPYMTDAAVEQELIDEAYDRFKNLVNVSHIMLPVDMMNNEAVAIIRADSIRNEILSGRLDWGEAASRFSIDGGSKNNKGLMGWLIPGRFPSAFEEMAYATQKGDISMPVNSGYGVHIIKVNDRKLNPGEVKARHILKLTARKSPEEAARAKEQIDSIYTILMSGADFAEVARNESEDPGSRNNGGELDWFGSGMMVAPFDSAAFSLPEGVVSHPIETSYGWHIIEVTGHRPMKERAEMEEQLKISVLNSEKGNLPKIRYIENKLKDYDSHLIVENLDMIRDMIAANAGGYDSTMIETLKTMQTPVATVAGETITLAEVMPAVPQTLARDASNARAQIEVAAKGRMESKTIEKAQIDMLNENPDYRNLVNEYSDGILLFDISQDKVWQKASSDREGLEEYFRTHKDKYKFDEPRYKAVIVFTTSDSLETEIKNYLNTLDPAKVNTAQLGRELREKFGKQVRAERVIAKKGENAITDYLAFGGPKPENNLMSWSNYFAYLGSIIDDPVEADDVRSKVTTDYQAELETQWVNDLRKKYKWNVDNKVLKTVKEIQPTSETK